MESVCALGWLIFYKCYFVKMLNEQIYREKLISVRIKRRKKLYCNGSASKNAGFSVGSPNFSRLIMRLRAL